MYYNEHTHTRTHACTHTQKEKKIRKKRMEKEQKEMRRARASKFAQGSRRMRGRRAVRGEKNPYKSEKRKTGWGNLFEGEGSGKGRGGKTRGRRMQRERKRGTRYEFARFIPPPVFKLRPDVFPPPAFLSALRFLLYRRDRTLSASRLAILPSKESKQQTQRNTRTVYIEEIENYTSVIIHCLNLSRTKF